MGGRARLHLVLVSGSGSKTSCPFPSAGAGWKAARAFVMEDVLDPGDAQEPPQSVRGVADRTTRPLTDSDATPLAAPTEHLVARTVITSALALGTFVLYYYVIADHVLHEPVVAGGMHSNTLGFIDWFALITLLYVVGFGSYNVQRALGEASSEADDSEPPRTDHLNSKYREIP